MAAPSVWQRALDLVHDIDFKKASDYGGILRAYNFTGVMIKIHDGAARTNEDGLGDWLREMRNYVPLIGGWGVQQNEPEAEAKLASELVQTLGLDFYVADAEGPHKGDWPGGDATRSLRFVAAYEQTPAQAKPHALTTFGAAISPWVLAHTEDNTLGPHYRQGPMRFQPWWKRGWRFIPQAYPNLDACYDVGPVIAHARRSGWPLPWTHLMIGLYPDRYGFPTGAEWVPKLIQARRLGVGAGFTTFLADAMNTRGDSDYKALGKLVVPFVAGAGAVAYK